MLSEKELNEINQLGKTLRVNNSYTIYKDKILAFDRHMVISEKSKKMKEDVGYTLVELKDININDSYFIPNGKEMYSVLKEIKKCNISEINNDLRVSNDTLSYDIINVNENRDIELYNEYLDKLSNYKPLILEGELDNLQEILDVNNVHVLNLPFNVRFRVTYGIIKGISKSTIKVTYDLYEVSIDDGVYVIIFTIYNKKNTIKHIYKFITY